MSTPINQPINSSISDSVTDQDIDALGQTTSAEEFADQMQQDGGMSTLSTSSMIAALLAPNSAQPVLPPPQLLIVLDAVNTSKSNNPAAVEGVDYNVDKAVKNAIIMDMLEAWNKSVAAEGEKSAAKAQEEKQITQDQEEQRLTDEQLQSDNVQGDVEEKSLENSQVAASTAAAAALVAAMNKPAESVNSNIGLEVIAAALASASTVASISSTAAQNAQEQVSQKMLAAWNADIREDAERQAANLASPSYLAAKKSMADQSTNVDFITSQNYQNWVNNLPTSEQTAQINLMLPVTMKIGLMDGVNTYLQDVNKGEANAKDALPIVATALMGSAATASDLALVDMMDPGALGIPGLYESLWTQMPEVGVSENMRAAMELVASLFAPMVVNKTNVDSVGKSGPDSPNFTIERARDLAAHALSLVQWKGLDAFTSAIIVRHMNQSEPMSKDAYVAFAKLIIISTALAMLYKVGGGSIRAGDFQGMLNGTTKFHDDPTTYGIVLQLVNLYHQTLDSVPAKERKVIESILFKWMDDNPNTGLLFKRMVGFNNLMRIMPSPTPAHPV